MVFILGDTSYILIEVMQATGLMHTQALSDQVQGLILGSLPFPDNNYSDFDVGILFRFVFCIVFTL